MKFFSTDSDLLSETQWFAGHILAHPDKPTVAERDLKRGSHRQPKQVQKVMNMLAAMGWARPSETRRTDSNVWEVNPLVHGEFAERAEWEQAERKRKTEQAAKVKRIREKSYSRRTK